MPNSPSVDHVHAHLTRRHFFGRSALGLGAAALNSLISPAGSAEPAGDRNSPAGGILRQLHVAPRARRVIYLFMHGGPSQLDLFDHKPDLIRQQGAELPDSV